MLGKVVSRAHRVTLGMGELALYHLVVLALFMQQRRRHAAETVAGRLWLSVA